MAPKNPVLEAVLNAGGGEVSFSESMVAVPSRGAEECGDAKGVFVVGDSLLAKKEVFD